MKRQSRFHLPASVDAGTWKRFEFAQRVALCYFTKLGLYYAQTVSRFDRESKFRPTVREYKPLARLYEPTIMKREISNANNSTVFYVGLETEICRKIGCRMFEFIYPLLLVYCSDCNFESVNSIAN